MKGKFCLGNGIFFGCSRVGVGWLFSIQSIVVCLCNVKPLLILYKSSHGAETAAWIPDKRTKRGKVKFSVQLGY